jgi:exopolyphosphatase / guanosine-5'-triphosphate,3'-diphosphate pyrophosphatase
VTGSGAPEPKVAAKDALGGIVPRWEWRTFGDSFGSADTVLDLQQPERVQESDEVYLLSQQSDASVKVRDDLMDVKQLEAVSGDGLEQWRPVLKGAFPLPAADVATMLHALGVAEAETARDAYTLEQLLEELVEPNDSLAAVDVHKQRAHYRVSGCMTELSEISSGGRSTRTIVVEGEDPALVFATVRELRLQQRPNVCLARGLKTMLGL